MSPSYGEDEDWLHELSISMFPEDGCLHVYGVGEVAATAFTPYGIECLKQFVDDERAAGLPNPLPQRDGLPCGVHRMLTPRLTSKRSISISTLRGANLLGRYPLELSDNVLRRPIVDPTSGAWDRDSERVHSSNE